MKNILTLFLWWTISFSAGWFGSQFKPGIWYENLQKPSWTPPAIAFPVAWSVLYTLMGTAAWLVWKRRAEHSLVSAGIVLFFVQLILMRFGHGFFLAVTKLVGPSWKYVFCG